MDANQNSNTIEPLTCATCSHYREFAGYRNGECYRFPPTRFQNNTQAVPDVKASRPACGEHPLWKPSPPQPVEKAVIPTPGQVTKAAREAKPAAKGSK